MTDFVDVSAALHAHLAFMGQWQLEARPDEISHSASLGDRLLLTYSSKASKRSVRIYFASANAGKPARFSTFIDAHDGRSFFLDDYLLEHGQKKILGLFHNRLPGKPIQEFSRDFARILQMILENSCSDLLHGKSWETAPFDWSPYK